MKKLIRHIKNLNRTRLRNRLEKKLTRHLTEKSPDFYILTPPHCLYIAEQIKIVLAQHQLRSSIILHTPQGGYADAPHFVICAQVYDTLPKRYIAYQLEQSGTSSWFTPKYIDALRNAEYVLDYSTRNVEFLKREGLSAERIRHIPFDYTLAPQPASTTNYQYDVAFYGNIQNNRRQHILPRLTREFKTLVITNSHGQALLNQLRQARCVVNIHYYENALLEAPRIYECLANQLLVVSEDAIDQEGHTNLEGIVEFVKTGDIDQLVARIRSLTTSDQAVRDRIARNAKALAGKENKFQSNFEKFLVEYFLARRVHA
jgi:hypothetical protein